MNTITELMPAAAAATSSARPVVVPASVMNPRAARLSVLAMISDMFGPGVSASSTQAAMKARNSWGDIGMTYRSA